MSSTVFITADAESPAPDMVFGGLTALERVLLHAQHKGADRAIVACHGQIPERKWRMTIERVSHTTPLPDGATLVRADEVAGVRITSGTRKREVEWRLMKSLPKSFQGPIDALINCHVSLRITRVLARTPITPNQVTIFALFLGLAAAAVLLVGTRSAVAIGGAMMAFQSIVDSCDGELARLRYQFSRLGQWLDNIADDITDSALMFALGAAAGGTWLWIGAAAGGARVFTQLALYVNVKRIGGDFWNFRWFFEQGAATMDDVYDLRSPLTWVRSLGRRDMYLFVWAILCVAGLPAIAAGYAAAISAVYVVLTLLHIAITRRPANAS